MKKFIVLLISLTFNPASYTQIYNFIELDSNYMTYYDIQSNGSAHLIQMDPATPDNLQVVFNHSGNIDSIIVGRKAVFGFSNDNGLNWSINGPLYPGIRSGFPVIRIMSNGSALIGVNSNFNGGIERAQWLADIAPGAGTFIILDPGENNNFPLWPNGIQTSSVTNQSKFVFAANTLLNRGLSITQSQFSGYANQSELSYSFKCAFALSLSGKIGMAYIMNEIVTPGKVSFRESTDNGVTWSTPVLIWDPLQNNNYGAYNGIDICYSGEVPKVVFETVKYISYTPDIHSTAQIQFWSPSVNSGNPVIIDSSNSMTGQNPQNDGYAPVCRPVIGISPNRILVAYCKANPNILDSNNYFDIYYTMSDLTGNSWNTPEKLTNFIGTQFDYRYVSISAMNGRSDRENFHLLAQKDSIPGSFVNGAERSPARIVYLKLQFTPPFGINNIGSEIPAGFLLKQNYPNPFNPKTSIDFDIPDESNVKIEVYNSIGKLVAVLADQRLAAGSYRTDWNAGNFASGIYFYTIKAGKFYDSKKMILIK